MYKKNSIHYSIIQPKYIRDMKKQKPMSHNQRNNHVLEICLPVINMKGLSGKDFKIVNIDMFKDMKEYIYL